MNKLIVLIAAVLLLSACAIPPKPFVDGAEVAPPLGCLGCSNPRGELLMSQAIGEIIDQVFDNVYNRFKYVPDLAAWGQIEYWASIQDDAVKMTRDGIVTGDCDDFALMCRYQLDAFRIENHLVFCQVETGEYYLVCEVNGWILDCRYKQIMPRNLLGYTWISRSGTKPGEPWHSIVE